MLPIGALFAFVGRQIGRLVQLAFNDYAALAASSAARNA